MPYVSVFVISLILSFLLTPIVRKIMLKSGILDMPKEFRWHRQPVALMGGIAIFASFILTVLLRIDFNREIIVILAGCGIIFVLGLLDDLLGTHPIFKFVVQILLASGVAYLGVVSRILPYNWLNVFLTIFWITGLMNALNLIDNMDGLSSGITTIAALGIFGLSLHNGEIGVALLCLALAGSCLGFLKYNFNPARIFMGDCGSMFLGYMLAVLSLLGGWQHSSLLVGTFLRPILILSVVIFDTTLVTILRLKNGKMPWHGGRDHSSHRLVHILGGKEKSAVLVLYGLGIIAGILGLITTRLNSLMTIIITIGWGIGMTLLGIRLAKVECYRVEKGNVENKSA